MTRHPATVKFPAQADRISALMESDEEFAGICRDYAQIVDEIAHKEHTLSRSSAVLVELLRLRSDLESDIAERLSGAEQSSAASEQDPPA